LPRALQQMNIQLERVLSDIMGVSGQAIIRAIVAGERDAVILAQQRNPGCRSSSELIAKALTGTWKEELLFVLGQALAVYDAYTTQIARCDTQIAQDLKAMEARSDVELEVSELPRAKRGSKSKNAPAFHARAEYARIVGGGSGERDGAVRLERADDHQRDRDGYEPLADGEALLCMVGAGAAERYLGREGAAVTDAQGGEPGGAGVSAGGTVGDAVR